MNGKDFLKITGHDNSKLAEYRKAIVNVINEYSEGTPIDTALRNNNLTYKKFINTIAIYPELLDNFEKAKIIHKDAFKERLLAIVHDNANKDWKAAKWLLETLYPEEFGKKIQIETDIKEDPAILAEYINVTKDKNEDNN